jgi:hypothetical protein
MEGSVREAARAGIGAKQADCLGFIAISWPNGNPDARQQTAGKRQIGNGGNASYRYRSPLQIGDSPIVSSLCIAAHECLFPSKIFRDIAMKLGLVCRDN